MGEEAYTILLNTKGDKSELSEELSELLSYIRNPKLEYHTELVNTIDRIISETKGLKETEGEYMLVSAKDMDRLDAAMEEGIDIGMQLGENRGMGKVVAQMFETLSIEEIADILKKDKSEIEEILASNIQ